MNTPSHAARLLPYSGAVLLSGVATGLGAIALVGILQLVERLAWGMTPGQDVVDAIDAASPIHRIITVGLAGLVAGLVWWGLRRARRDPVPLTRGIAGERMPAGRTLLHVITQVVIVGAGMSIGKEVAPRELAAWASGGIADRLRLSEEDRSILVASAAGAGLAAVYGLPFAGIAFTIELLLPRRTRRGVVTAIVMSAVAVGVAQFVVGWEPYYALPQVAVGWSLLGWSLVVGPLVGVAALGMARALRWIGARRGPEWWPLVALPVVGVAVGAVAIWLPQVLGNGHSVAQFAFSMEASAGSDLGAILVLAGVVAVLGVVKAVATLATIGAGAWGGVLTPSIGVGAALGVASGLLWSVPFPGSSLAGFAFVGAAVFLSIVQRSPVTAIVLVAEFTHVAGWVLLPTAAAVGVATALRWWVERVR